MSGVTNGMGHYEGEVIQLLSNLRATLLGKELVDGREERGERKLRPAGFPPLSTIAIHDKVKFVSKLAVLTEREERGGERKERKK